MWSFYHQEACPRSVVNKWPSVGSHPQSTVVEDAGWIGQFRGQHAWCWNHVILSTMIQVPGAFTGSATTYKYQKWHVSPPPASTRPNHHDVGTCITPPTAKAERKNTTGVTLHKGHSQKLTPSPNIKRTRSEGESKPWHLWVFFTHQEQSSNPTPQNWPMQWAPQGSSGWSCHLVSPPKDCLSQSAHGSFPGVAFWSQGFQQNARIYASLGALLIAKDHAGDSLLSGRNL